MDSDSDNDSNQLSEISPNEIETEVDRPHSIGGFSSIEEFTKNGLSLIMQASKCPNAFPSGPSRDLYSTYPAFNNIVEEQSNKILGIISNVIKLNQIKGNIQRRDNDEKFELLLECNDTILERINSNLDEIAGIKKMPETVLIQTEIKTNAVPNKQASGSWNESRKVPTSTAVRTAKLITAKNIIRPQINFKTPIDNSPLRPFEPRITYKPNSIKPLAVLPEYGDDGSIISYLHPYEFELEKFTISSNQLMKIEPEIPSNLVDTPLVYVDSQGKLNNLLTDLSKEKAIAVDLEHHSYRTFQGITCLLQISSRTKDYIIDTLTLRDDVHVLNEVFTNPKIVKVFHGADLDIEWLQRDLSLYVVNMFDTHQAAKRLNLARLSLAFLLKQYCQIDADKTFQLADWRIRPLPEELITYARQDTHYLLYIYDLMTNELLKNANGQVNVLQSVYQASTEICKKRYIKPIKYPDSYMELYRKSKRVFDNRQLYALDAIYSWRDKIARQEDESYGYILPNHMLLQIAEILPREMQGILACCNPIPPMVRQHLHILHQIVLKAREQSLVKPIPEELNTNRASALNKNKDLSSLLFCPHDLSYNKEFRDDLPTLLDKKILNDVNLVNRKMLKKPSLSVFDTPEHSDNEEDVREKLRKINQTKFVSPYARYLSILPLAEKQRLEDLAKQQLENKKKRLCPGENEQLEFIVKQEVIEVQEEVNIPLKDVGKRKRNENFKPKEDPNEPDQPKKKFKIDTSTSEVSLTNMKNGNIDNESQSTSNQTGSPNKNKKTKKIDKKKSKKAAARLTKQASSKPVQFDYKSVDFNKFAGGSKKNNLNRNKLPPKFKGIGKNFRGKDKKFNKLLNFDKSNKKK